MRSLRIHHGSVVTPDALLKDCPIRIEGSVIAQIGPAANHFPADEIWDAEGCLILPGIIDLHTDALDAEIVPRPGADIPILIAFRELERKMSGCGITTVYHSLHLGYDKAEMNSHSKYSRQEMFQEVFKATRGSTLLNNKIHLRFELTGVNSYQECFELMDRGCISLLSVMDHTPGQGQLSDVERYLAHSMKAGRSREQALEELEESKNRPIIEGEKLKSLIGHAKMRNIPVASHDDDSREKVNEMLDLGVEICEFPINLETALHAMQLDMHVIGGATNILRGGSLSGNLDMKEAVLRNAVDSLCSDYYPPSILHTIFLLVRESAMPLPQAVRLATLHPAQAARIDHQTGSLEEGKQADLILVRLIDGIPMVTQTMVQGVAVAQASLKPDLLDNHIHHPLMSSSHA